MIERQVWDRVRWTEEIVAIDDLAWLIDDLAAVAWDRDVATAPGLPWDGMPRLYDHAAMREARYTAPCVVFGRPMGYWTVVAVWLAFDKRWDVRRRRERDMPGYRTRRQRHDLVDYVRDDTWIRIAST